MVIFREHAANEVLCAGTDSLPFSAVKSRLIRATQDSGGNFLRASTNEWKLATNEQMQDHTNAPNVAASVISYRHLTHEARVRSIHLRCDVEGSACHAYDVSLLKVHRTAEFFQLVNVSNRTITLMNDDVLWVDIAMYIVLHMAMSDGLEDLLCDDCDRMLRDWTRHSGDEI